MSGNEVPRSGGAGAAGWLSVLKRVCGMPDYDGYLTHMRERHPGGEVLSEAEFFKVQLSARYGNGPSRCC